MFTLNMNDLYDVNVANCKTIINKTKLFTASRAEINVVHHHLFQHYKDKEFHLSCDKIFNHVSFNCSAL